MKTKTFVIIIIALAVLCAALTIAHAVYAVYAYEHCSIIYYISKELW